MKLLLPATVCAILFFTPLTSATAADEETLVFILAGQSNMEGQGVVEMDHPKYYNGGKGNLVWSMEQGRSRETMQHLRDKDGNWTVRDDVRISFTAKGVLREGPLTIGFTEKSTQVYLCL